MTDRQIVSIWFHQWSMERWRRMRRRAGAPARDEAPLVLARDGPHGPVIHAASQAARAAGAKVGARVVDARAIYPDLIVDDADIPGDASALDQLALWCRRWCPWSAADGQDGVVLDATGSTHLWGGDAAMLETIEDTFNRLGYRARLAMAPTHAAAWALARFAEKPGGICSPEGVSAALAPLPVTALRLDADSVLLLRRFGLKTVGALAAIPRMALARRFAKDQKGLETPLMRLDQAFGTRPEPIISPAPPHQFRAMVRLADPTPGAALYLPELAEALCVDLVEKGFGARRLRFEAFRVDGETSVVEASTSRPTRSAAHLTRLFHGRFEKIDPGFGFDALALAASVAEPLDATQTRLDGGEDDDVAMAMLIDRLVARLGPEAVMRPRRTESHLPERAEQWVHALDAMGEEISARPSRERPIKLLATPEEVKVVYSVPEGPPAQFVWRRLTHRMARYEGPERIAPEWWRARYSTRLRDYYHVEDTEGRRYWLFREGVVGDGRGGDPRWFVHGIFA